MSGKRIIQVHTLDGTRKSMVADESTTALSVVEEMAKAVDLGSCGTFSIFEVRLLEGRKVTSWPIEATTCILEMVTDWDRLVEEGLIPEFPRIVMQKMIFTDDSPDAKGRVLEFVQAREAVLAGELDATPEEAVGLGALCMVPR